MGIASRFFRWHRWLGYLVALQVLLWVAGGVVFAWLPFQGWVKAQDGVRKPELELPADALARLAAARPSGPPLKGLQAVATARGPAWRLRGPDGEQWLDLDGRPLPPPGAEEVRRFATALYRGDAAHLREVKALPEAPRRLGLVREVPAGRAVWVAAFDDALRTRLYVDARSGELLAARNEAWVWYDFFWRLHVMDYAEGEDFNNPLLRAAAPAALALVLTGAVLLVLALRRAWRRR